MNDSYPSLCVVLAVTSDAALLDLGGIPNVIRTLDLLIDLFPSQSIAIAVSPENAPAVRTVLNARSNDFEFLICQPLKPAALARALKPFFLNSESVLIHDACRPLTSKDQFERVISAFDKEIDAVRPAMPFTETLKILGQDSIIKETLDRSSVLRISTPELIRVAAIDTHEPDCGWFLPLKMGARILHIEGVPEGSRINTPADRDLMELHQN